MQDIKNAIEVKVDYYSLRQIIYDCQTIAGLVPFIRANNFLALGINPYLTLAAYDVMEILFKDVKDQIPYSHDIEDVRMKLKFFEDGYSKSKNMIQNIDCLQDEIFKNMITMPSLRDLNIHSNISIYTNIEKKVIGNTQYFYYLLRDNRLLKNDLKDVINEYTSKPDDFSFNKEVEDKCREYAFTCTRIIKNACEWFVNIIPPIEVKSKANNIDLYSLDCNTNCDFFSDVKTDKEMKLYLLHLLSTINFLLYVLNGYEQDDYGWWLKINYITYYYSIHRLTNLQNHYIQNKLLTPEISSFFDELNLNNAPNMSVEFRNYTMHSKFGVKNGQYTIPNSYLDETKPLFGFVETCFDGRNYNEVKSSVMKELHRLSDIIAKWLDTQSLNIKPFKQ